jgi:3-oxoacyl-[acyl-carrier protein] reductase
MDLELKSKTAVVTGASIGIGRAIAKGLALEGVRVVAVARRKELLSHLAQEVQAAGGSAVVPMARSGRRRKKACRSRDRRTGRRGYSGQQCGRQ